MHLLILCYHHGNCLSRSMLTDRFIPLYWHPWKFCSHTLKCEYEKYPLRLVKKCEIWVRTEWTSGGQLLIVMILLMYATICLIIHQAMAMKQFQHYQHILTGSCCWDYYLGSSETDSTGNPPINMLLQHFQRYQHFFAGTCSVILRLHQRPQISPIAAIYSPRYDCRSRLFNMLYILH